MTADYPWPGELPQAIHWKPKHSLGRPIRSLLALTCLSEKRAGIRTPFFMVEDVKAEGGYVILPPGQARGANLRLAGEDVKIGDTVLRAGTLLRPQDIGMAASVGRSHLTVHQKLRVAVFSTGDEIRNPGDELEPGTIYDINRFTVPAMLTNLAAELRILAFFRTTWTPFKKA